MSRHRYVIWPKNHSNVKVRRYEGSIDPVTARGKLDKGSEMKTLGDEQI